jgi:hypothetical protein
MTPQLEAAIAAIKPLSSTERQQVLGLLLQMNTENFADREPTTLPPVNQAAIDLLRSWRETGNEQEQRETWEFLEKALDEDRLSDRPLFPQ